MNENKSTKEKSCLLIIIIIINIVKKKLEIQYSVINPFYFSLCFEW